MRSLTATEVLTNLGRIVQADKSQADQARFVLPFILLMRLDTKLLPTRDKLRESLSSWDKQALSADVSEQSLDAQEAREITGQYFFNLSTYDLQGTHDAQDVLRRIQDLVTGFSPRVRSLLIDGLGLNAKATELHKSKTLFRFVGELIAIQKRTAKLGDREFGRLLSDLLQLLSEGTSDDASECATPQDVVDLMVSLLARTATGDERTSLTVYDPTYGTAGLLVSAAGKLRTHHNDADVRLQGHEKRGEMHSLGALSALLQVSTFNGQRPEDAGAVGGVVDLAKENSLKPGARAAGTADYAVCNPPQGKSGKWGNVRSSVMAEAGAGNSRFAAGTPAVGDASLLFLQQVLDRLTCGGRAVLSLNGSPLFAGQVSAKGKNEQAVRGWLFDHKYLEAIVALPPNVHFNTGIPTYLWVLDKQRPSEREERVVLVDAAGSPGEASEEMTCFARIRKRNQNKKRFDLTRPGIADIVSMVRAFENVDRIDADGQPVPVARVVSTDTFRFRVVKVHRPLRLCVHISADRLERLSEKEMWSELKAKDSRTWEALSALLQGRVGYETNDAAKFDRDLKSWVREKGLRLPKPKIREAILEALSERDLSAVAQRDAGGNLIPDSELADEERVPWDESTADYVAREVRPFVPEVDRDLLWTEEDELAGAEIPFRRIFYRYQAPRSLSEIGEDIRDSRREIDRLLDDVERDLL